MALGRGEIDQPAVCDQIQAPAAGHRELVHQSTRLAGFDREVAERSDLDLDVEVPGVGEDRTVLHALEVRPADDVLVSCRRAEDIAEGGSSVHRHDLEAVHRGLERAHGIDLRDEHVSAHASRALSDPTSDPAVAGDDEASAREQDVRRADDSVDGRLSRAVAVVEQVLRQRLIDRDYRKPSFPSRSRAFSRMTPVVVSSVPAMTSPSCSRRAEWTTPITSAPSSIVRCGRWSTAASM